MKASLDHVVFWVKDVVASIDFYEKVVGLPGVRTAEFRAGEVPFPSVRVSGESIVDLMPVTSAAGTSELTKTPDSAGFPINHICLALSAVEYHALDGRLTEHGVDTSSRLTPPDTFGAQGMSPEVFYFHDPDGNVIEARYYE